MSSDPHQTGGGNGGNAPDEPTRSDLALVQQALRQDWPISPAAKKQLLQKLVNTATRSKFERNRIAAAKAIALFGRLALGQQALDLAREKARGDGEEFTLADLVAEAEKIAEGHAPAERPKELPGP